MNVYTATLSSDNLFVMPLEFSAGEMIIAGLGLALCAVLVLDLVYQVVKGRR